MTWHFFCDEVRDTMLYIGLDDTDQIGTPGTGRLARGVAESLAGDYNVRGVSRHQLLVHPDVPYTKNNSANVVILRDGTENLAQLVDRVTEYVAPRCAQGSDPALCVATDKQVRGLTFGLRCQTELMNVRQAETTAASRLIYLQSLAGLPCGMIGALAGVCLAGSGNDGRFVQIGSIRELKGAVLIDEIISAGVSRVVTEDDESVTSGTVQTGDKLRPALRDGRPVLYVRPCGPNVWQALKV